MVDAFVGGGAERPRACGSDLRGGRHLPSTPEITGGNQPVWLPLLVTVGAAVGPAERAPAAAAAGRGGIDDVSNAYVITAVAIASALTSKARRLMLPSSGYNRSSWRYTSGSPPSRTGVKLSHGSW